MAGPLHAQPGLVKTLSTADFKRILAQTPSRILLDVRTDAEVVQGVITGARQLDYLNPDFPQQIAKLDKSIPVFVYCAVGGRSGKAIKLLSAQGFNTVYNLEGGMKAWQTAGYSTAAKK